MGKDNKSSEIRFRMDFVMRIESFDEKTGKAKVVFEPNPKRYEWKVENGKKYLFDKLDKIIIPQDALAQAASKMNGMPVYFEPPLILDVEKYIKSRIFHIQKFLNEYKEPPSFQDKSEEFLKSLEIDQLAFVIMSIDIVGSTKIAISLDSKKYAKLISTVLFEISNVIPKFHGYILKYTGDGLIAYFPEPSFITKNDLAVNCSIIIRRLVSEGLNTVLNDNNFPCIEIRIGLDSGDAFVETIGSPEAKQHKDIIGSVVNLATKIQSKAKPGQIYLGASVERNLHTSWRLYCEPVSVNDWLYKDTNGEIYRLFRIRI